MRKLLCPQCKIAGLYVKNERRERLLVYVSDEGEVAVSYTHLLLFIESAMFLLCAAISLCYGEQDYQYFLYTILLRCV